MPPGTYRATFSLPCDLATAISRVAKRMGISQSALLATVLTEPLADLESLLQLVPEDPTPDQVLRLRGDSVAIIRQRMAELQAQLPDATA